MRNPAMSCLQLFKHTRALCFRLGATQRRHQHGRHDANDGDDDQQFDQRERAFSRDLGSKQWNS